MVHGLLLTASAIFLVAFLIYNKGVLKGENLPPFAAFALFSIITGINFVTYLGFTKDPVNIAVFVTDFIICVGTTLAIVIRVKGRVSIDKHDQVIGLMSLVAVLVWVMYRTAAGGNLINLFPYSFAFIPIYRNVLRDPRQEPTLPWLLWTLAFVLNIAALVPQSTTKPVDYVAPIVCLLHHLAITLLSLRKPQTLAVDI